MLAPPMVGVVLPLTYPVVRGTALVAREASSSTSRQPRLLDRVREAVRARHYSRRTEKAYVAGRMTVELEPYHRNVSEADLISDLRRVAASLRTDTVSWQQYGRVGLNRSFRPASCRRRAGR